MHDEDESEAWAERARVATIAFLDNAGRDYLKTTGASPLKRWEVLTNRARSAARTCETAREWTTAVLRGLKVASPSKWTSSAVRDLADAAHRRDAEWLDIVERELGYLMAEVQLLAEQRKQASGGGAGRNDAGDGVEWVIV